ECLPHDRSRGTAMSADPLPAASPPASSAEDALLLRQDADGIATLTLNRPAARNALSLALMVALEAELQAIRQDESVKVVVLAAAGPAFCAGHDLKELRADPSREHYERIFAQCSALMLAITRLPKP